MFLFVQSVNTIRSCIPFQLIPLSKTVNGKSSQEWLQEYFQPKICRKIRIFSLGWKKKFSNIWKKECILFRFVLLKHNIPIHFEPFWLSISTLSGTRSAISLRMLAAISAQILKKRRETLRACIRPTLFGQKYHAGASCLAKPILRKKKLFAV